MPVVQVVHPPGYAAERAYAVEVVLGDLLGLNVEIGAGPVEEWQLRVGEAQLEVADVLFRAPESEWLTRDLLPSPPLERHGDLPVLYGRPPYESNGRLGVDVFGGAFVLLTRYEEAVLPDRDVHGRFPAEASLAAREGFLERPLADDYAELLWKALRRVAPRLERPARPGYRLVPSHDVDYPHVPRPLRYALGELRRGRPVGLWVLLGRDPFDTFDMLMAASERRGLRAAFYFIAGDASYSLDDSWIRALLRRIHERGHEIGFHASYHTLDHPERLRGELGRLVQVCAEEGIEREAWGGRQHFLRWNPATWVAWDDAGLAYDSTLGYSARPGFRAGTCHEYPAFDLRGRRRLRLRERPLVLMDTPTLDRLGLSDEELERLIERLRAECGRLGGDFTVLWHNNWLVTPRQRRLLERTLG